MSEVAQLSLMQEFSRDRQGRRYTDVVSDTRLSFPAVLGWLEEPERLRRMIESELHHDRPALAGVVRELEARKDVDEFFRTHAGPATTRFRQAVGVAVRILMQSQGWEKTGRKGSLGARTKSSPEVTRAGTRHNTGGLALWFLRAERYMRPAGMPFGSVAERSAGIEDSRPIVSAT